MDIKSIVIAILNKVVEEKIEFSIASSDNIFTTYDDSTGQRSCILEHYGYGKANPETYPCLYKVLRKLSFCNTSDEGKEGAVLCTISLHEEQINNLKVFEVTKNRLTLNNYIFYFRKSIL